MIGSVANTARGIAACGVPHRSTIEGIEAEERQLFPKVLQTRLDLSAIGQQVQAFEAGLLAARAHRPATLDMRQ